MLLLLRVYTATAASGSRSYACTPSDETKPREMSAGHHVTLRHHFGQVQFRNFERAIQQHDQIYVFTVSFQCQLPRTYWSVSSASLPNKNSHQGRFSRAAVSKVRINLHNGVFNNRAVGRVQSSRLLTFVLLESHVNVAHPAQRTGVLLF